LIDCAVNLTSSFSIKHNYTTNYSLTSFMGCFMKLFTRVLLISLFVLVIASQCSYSQFTFGVKPGATLNSGYAGIKFGGIVAFGGFEFIHGGADINFTYKDTGYPDDANKMHYSGSLCVPYVGAKMFLLNSGNIKGYATATISKPWVSASIQPDSGKEAVAYDFTSSHGDKALVKDLVSNTSLWGFSVAFGSEYFFSDNFSLGGEFGIRYLIGGWKKTITTYSSPTAKSTVDVDVSVGVSSTYSTLTLNYYF
jgi:hypothetical protein